MSGPAERPTERPTERMVAIRDGAVSFRVLSGGQGVPLVYFHSVHERGGWSPFVERLARRYSVVAPFHPGVQGSTGVERLDDVLDLILAYDELLERLGLASAHLVGHFFGAMVAAELAAIFPGRVRRLVLVSPAGLWLDAAPTADVLILPFEELTGLLWADPGCEAARRWIALPEGDAENVAAQVESIQRRAAIGKFVWPIPDKGIAKRLHRIAAPTLLLWGADDRANPVAYGEAWQRRIKGAALAVVPGGHMLIHEAPDPSAAQVEAFLG